MGFAVVWTDNIPIHPLLANKVWDKLAQCGSEVCVLPAKEVLAWLRMRAATPTGKAKHGKPSSWWACENVCVLRVQKPATHSAVTGQKTREIGHTIKWHCNKRQTESVAFVLASARGLIWFCNKYDGSWVWFWSDSQEFIKNPIWGCDKWSD